MDDALETVDLDVDGAVIKVAVTRQHSEALAAWGFPPERNVYRVSWNPVRQIPFRLANGLSAERLRAQLELIGELTCREHGVAVEINCRPERMDPPDPLLRLAAGMGCLFAIDTDAHAPGQLDWLGNGTARAEKFGIPPDRVLNTRTAESITGRNIPSK
jgi:putative hydrolase